MIPVVMEQEPTYTSWLTLGVFNDSSVFYIRKGEEVLYTLEENIGAMNRFACHKALSPYSARLSKGFHGVPIYRFERRTECVTCFLNKSRPRTRVIDQKTKRKVADVKNPTTTPCLCSSNNIQVSVDGQL